LLYAPLRLSDGRITAVVSVDDPLDGLQPTRESLAPLELFLRQAAVAIENAKLLCQLKEYTELLEEKVEKRTLELRNVQAQLLKSERLAAIGELAGMVGHDLRNPLTGIAGAAYYLRTKLGPKLDEKSRKMIDIIEEDISHSNKIINDLLEYSREIKLELESTDPASILKEAIALVNAPKNIEVSTRASTTPTMIVDVDKMRRIFANIIRNAFDAMPKGGKLKIESRRVKNDVVFRFTDTGSGMTKETIEKLWTPLFTTKSRGMGFGLPICKRFVESHGGKISAESTLGKGATFTVVIPIKPSVKEGGEKVWVNWPESLLSTMMKA